MLSFILKCINLPDYLFYDKLRLIFIELFSFMKRPEDLETALDKWLYMGTITKFKVEKDPFYQDGVKTGEAKGRHEEALEIAQNFKALGLAIADIAKGLVFL